MSLVFDPIYIKQIEKRIGRKLDDFELDSIKYGEPVHLQAHSGEWVSFDVPYCSLESLGPDFQGEDSFFGYVFNAGTLKKVSSNGR